MDTLQEKKCIKQAMQGDERALATLLQDNYSFLYKYLIKITMDPHVAEDLVQETMATCIEKIGTYNGKAKFSSWLITIATHMYIDDLRRKKREKQWRDQQRALRKMHWQAQYVREEWPAVLDALAKCAYDVRVPLVLKHYYGYTYEEIAAMTGIAAGTVKSRVHNGLKKLRKELTQGE